MTKPQPLTPETVTDEQAREVGCPRCRVAYGTRCTAMNRSGYAPIHRAHFERRAKAAEILNERARAGKEETK